MPNRGFVVRSMSVERLADAEQHIALLADGWDEAEARVRGLEADLLLAWESVDSLTRQLGHSDRRDGEVLSSSEEKVR